MKIVAAKVVQTQASNGSHFIEVHMGTVGIAGVIIMFFAFMGCMFILVGRSCKRRLQDVLPHMMLPPQLTMFDAAHDAAAARALPAPAAHGPGHGPSTLGEAPGVSCTRTGPITGGPGGSYA